MLWLVPENSVDLKRQYDMTHTPHVALPYMAPHPPLGSKFTIEFDRGTGMVARHCGIGFVCSVPYLSMFDCFFVIQYGTDQVVDTVYPPIAPITCTLCKYAW